MIKADYLSKPWTPSYDFDDESGVEAVHIDALLGQEQIKLSLLPDDSPVLDASGENYPYNAVFEEIVDYIDATSSGAILLSATAATGYSLTLAFIDQGGYAIDIDNKIVTLNHHGVSRETLENSDHYKSSILLSLVRALRDIWHECRMSDIYEFLNPENILKIERFRAADIEAVTAHILWQLRCEGESDLWRCLLSERDGDIAIKYMQVAERGAGKEMTIRALQAAFKAWFTDAERSEACDHDALELMDQKIEAAAP